MLNISLCSRAYTGISNYNYGSRLLSALHLHAPTLANMGLVQARTLPLQDSKNSLLSRQFYGYVWTKVDCRRLWLSMESLRPGRVRDLEFFLGGAMFLIFSRER